ncbi:hypothetical protein CPB85DRAFT_1560204 [Mucidula mucida]|nr:hypothetical protein CPB85DRAFT_1560204 [Mucidula mucida]
MSTKISVLACILFPCLSVSATYFLLGHMFRSGGDELIGEQCPPVGSGPFSLAYTGIRTMDTVLCFYVAFFDSVMHPSILPLIAEFGASAATVVILPTVEASRNIRSSILSFPFPVLFGLFYQVMGAGISFPLFALAMIIYGHMDLTNEQARIDLSTAQANLFGLVSGYIIPSLVMYKLNNPIVTALWQPFPAWIALFRACYLLLRPTGSHTRDGYSTVQATWALTFMLSALAHLSALWDVWGDMDAFAYQFTPHVAIPTAETLPFAVLVFMQWDMYFTLGGSLLGALWFAHKPNETLTLITWSVIASLILGPGAAMSGALMWREWGYTIATGANRLKRYLNEIRHFKLHSTRSNNNANVDFLSRVLFIMV